MKNKPLNIFNATIQPGEVASLAFPMPEISSYAPIYMPIKVVHGKQTGPTLLVLAAIHGDELNGTEIVNRLLGLSLLKKLTGTLIMIPVFNVYGYITRSRYLTDGLELDKAFPGRATGSHAARLAHLFTSEILSQVDYCIDLRTGAINHSNLPQIYINPEIEQNEQLARAFKAPVICHVKAEKNTLRATASKKNIPYLIYEAGEALRFDERAIKVGLKGITNVLRHLKMLPELNKPKQKTATSFVVESYNWIRAPKSGTAYSNIKLGQKVSEKEQIAVVKDPFGSSDNVYVRAPHDGIIVGKNNLPLVHEGETLFQIAIFKKGKEVAAKLKEWKEINA
ncbi:MAG: succinylglutamate desuccinylase/aspartoacylase family protein [Gammaproteobacteria bacterium]|jgi:predicted deacylase